MRKLIPLAFLAAAAALAWLFFPGPRVHVDIPDGLSAHQTATLLRREGVVRSALVFRVWAKATRMDRKLKPGRYLLRKGMWPGTLLKKLRDGDTERVKLTVPEGLMAGQIAERLQTAGVTKAEPFLDYVYKNNLEGYLFPTTYFFPAGMSAEAVAHAMHGEFDKRIPAEFRKVEQSRFTMHQVLTLASIVQREAYHVEEMPMIAGVYSNRLKKRMRLNADPTVQYAILKAQRKWKKNLTFKDLEIPSPYNTYAHFGLPPGPICSPGVEAFRAALRPADTDALYFVGDADGKLIFNKTFDEHRRDKFKAKRDARKRSRQK